MKISTAMALGRTLIQPIAGTHLNNARTGGCAWGMVNVAAPLLYRDHFGRALDTGVDLPCGCTGICIGNSMMPQDAATLDNLASAMVHLFNDHVMTRKDWTMDRLIDWVASVEPADPKEQTECLATENAKSAVAAKGSSLSTECGFACAASR